MSLEYEPRFTEPLKGSYKVREGHPIKLSCRFDASPKGLIEWLKDGIPIDFDALGISRDFKVNFFFFSEIKSKIIGFFCFFFGKSNRLLKKLIIQHY